ncbi:hypothetical protein [Streptomyces sp. NPDC051001]|uniref:hypothetical protein n=1 Tax=Streptomyces sp. NPDC051001 TaxID=3155795 RepID=UPI00343285AB
MDSRDWLTLADRVRAEGAYDYADLARDLARQLTWPGALDVATALRSFVYGQPGGSDLHKDVELLYRRLGWEQSALVACWFRDAHNRPAARSKRRPGGWPTATPTTEEHTVTSHVEQQVQARIAAARAKVQGAKQQRDELGAARRRGLAARHANKLRRQAEQRQADDGDGDQDGEPGCFR